MRSALLKVLCLFMLGSFAGCGGRTRSSQGATASEGGAGQGERPPSTGGAPGSGTGPIDDLSACYADGGFMLDRDANLALPTLLLVMDASSTAAASTPAGDTVWDETMAALGEAVALLPDGLPFGLVTFPDLTVPDHRVCSSIERIHLTPLDATGRGAITSWLPDVEQPDGPRDVEQGFMLALAALTDAQARGNRALVLVTTGLPNVDEDCSDFPAQPSRADLGPLFDAVASAQTSGIPTYIIGSAGSDSERDLLSALAVAGGTAAQACADLGGSPPCHYDASQLDGLAGRLELSIDLIARHELERAGCAIRIPAEIAGRGYGVSLLTSDGKADLPRTAGLLCDDGWELGSITTGTETHPTVVLCSNSCARYFADPTARVVLDCNAPPTPLPMRR